MVNHRIAIIVSIAVAGTVASLPRNIRAAAKGKSAHEHESAAKSGKVHLMPGLGEVHHPVSTKNPQAQKFFDQGLALVYGFDHEAAKRCFEQAAKLDPNLAMAWWGMALALGPNINLPVDPEREKAAYDAIQRAVSLQDKASEPERAYINALAFRYSNDPKADLRQLDVTYRQAMSKLVKSYPDDLDAATLYAESMMDLHPWQHWTHDGRPNEDTEEIVAVLESVLKRDPNHLGANHYYIHAIEASPHPEWGLASATRLEKLAPAAGHLTHMPAHIQARVGDHLASAESNRKAIAADKKFYAVQGQGVIAVMYHVHNIHFLAYASTMTGNFNEAKKAADSVAASAAPHFGEMPEMDGFISNFVVTPLAVLVAFERWDEILKLPPTDPSHLIPAAAWHFARTMALAAKGDADAAQKEYAAWQQLSSKIPADQMINETNNIGAVLKVHNNLMSAALAQGQHNDKQRIDFLRQAAAAEDALNYSEPPAIFPR